MQKSHPSPLTSLFSQKAKIIINIVIIIYLFIYIYVFIFLVHLTQIHSVQLLYFKQHKKA